MEDETVQVIHHSFTEFLLDRQRDMRQTQITRQFPILVSQDIHRKIAVSCLNYLQSGVLKLHDQVRRGEDDNQKATLDGYDYQKARLQYPCLDYAVQNWGYHASKYDVNDQTFFASIKTWTEADSDFRRWLSLLKTSKYLPSSSPAPSLLHIAAFAGLAQFAKCLLHEGQRVDPRDAEERTPLLWASSSGHAEMVSILLKHGANPDAEDSTGVQSIHLAARQNAYSIVKILLEAGVDPLSPKSEECIGPSGIRRPDLPRTKGETAVHLVCKLGHTETILVMIPFLRPASLEEVLCETCRYGKFESARSALESSEVSVNSKFRGATALYLACVGKSVNCVKLLLERGADVNLRSQWSPLPRFHGGIAPAQDPRTPLDGLARTWDDANHPTCLQIFHMLIRAGADVNQKDTNGETPLLAGQCNHPDRTSMLAAKTLVEAGANISQVYKDGDTILHRAVALYRDIGMFDFFLKLGASVTARGYQGRSVIHVILAQHSSPLLSLKNTVHEIIEFLLEKGAPVHVKDASGKSALEVAMLSSSCNFETFRLLLRSCPDESIRKKCLWLICSKDATERVQFIQELQAVGMSVDDRNGKGETLLLTTIRSGDTWKALVDCGASLDAMDFRGRGALHHFIQSRSSIKQLQALIDAGLDPHAEDDKGGTMLHIVACEYEGTEQEAKLVEYLLNLGLSVNARNKIGRTPLLLHIEEPILRRNLNNISSIETPRISLLNLFQKVGDALDVNIQDNDGLSALHLAALNSEFEIEQLLDAGADPTLVTKDGRTALHVACGAKKAGVVGLLLHRTHGDIIGKTDSSGRTALHIACASCCPESVSYLLKHGADVTAKDSKEQTPLHSCSTFSFEAPLQHRNIAGGMKGYQPHQSGTFAILGIVKSLLAAGADPNVVDEHEQSPLELALSHNCIEMVHTLEFTVDGLQKKKGLELQELRFNIKDVLGRRTPLRYRLKEDVRQEVFRHPAKYLTLLRFDDIDWLIENGANLTGGNSEVIHTSDGESFVHVVAKNGLTEIMESLGSLARYYDDPTSVKSRLIKAGYKGRYLEQFNPILHAACEREFPNMRMIQVLVEKCGVDVNGHALFWTRPRQIRNLETGTGDGPTALHCLALASRWWYLDAIRYLVEHGANVDSRNESGESPLHVACRGFEGPNITFIGKPGLWATDCVRLLLELGANPNALDDDGLSSLNKAKASPKAIKVLLERGAHLSVGKISPLLSAIESQHLESLRIMVDAGADVNTKDNAKTFAIGYQVKDQERSALICASFPSTVRNGSIPDSVPLVKLLIERGAHLYSPLNNTETLIHYVLEHAEYEIACAFASCKHVINFDARDQLGRTVFLAACNSIHASPRIEQGNWLDKKAPALQILEYGADPLAVDTEGRNALHHLLENPQMEERAVLQFLWHDAGKKLLRQRDRKGFTPLNSAFRFLRPVLVEVLLTMGADLLQPDPNGTTALHQIAAQCLLNYKQQRRNGLREIQDPLYFAQCVWLWNKFLGLGGDINARDNEGSPPLFSYLCTCNRVEFLKSYQELFDKADVHVRNNDGETALHIIARSKRKIDAPNPGVDEEEICKRLFEFMVSKGLDPLAEDARGRSSIDVAVACGKNKILGLFQYRS